MAKSEMERILGKWDGYEADLTPYPLVYFIGALDRPRHPIKIGRSTTESIHRRLDTIQTGCPYRLDFLYVAEVEGSVETGLHRAFKEQRLHGEWFKRNKLMNDFLESLWRDNPDWRDVLKLRMRLKQTADVD